MKNRNNIQNYRLPPTVSRMDLVIFKKLFLKYQTAMQCCQLLFEKSTDPCGLLSVEDGSHGL